jgi:hypothetical protein
MPLVAGAEAALLRRALRASLRQEEVHRRQYRKRKA